ncbi:DMT family transporter [Rhodoferax sp.]|uniref:DMT family transporter n=1 Tax=Rhodoferax sp. TaxID=50421 RepID=UPI0025F032A7|nr:DMT family transporter [Rhodoferax sp.]
MQERLTFRTALLLAFGPLMWAGNAVVGRVVHTLVPPVTLNFLRWTLAFAILLPLGGWIFKRGRGLWSHWRRFALLGLLGVGLYNALQYMALQTSSPINVTLVGASLPMCMLAVGALFFGAQVSRPQVLGALLSLAGVLLVLGRGEWQQLLALRLVPGDIFMLLATVAFAFYSWLLTQPKDPPAIRADWAAFLLAQISFGLLWSGSMTAVEWSLGAAPIQWSWTLAAALVFVAVGPAVLAYRAWGEGMQRVGPNVAGVFINLTPLFATVMSSAFLGEWPHPYHGLAFGLIVGGILVSARR